VTAAVGPSAIVNAAAYTAVDRAEAEPERAFAVNCDGAALLAGAAARRGIPFIQISTDYVFDGSKPSPYREDDLPAPLNVYGSSSGFGRPTAVTMAELTTSRVTVKRIGMDLRPPSSRASPAAGDVSRDCRPSRRRNIRLQLAVPKVPAWTHPRRSASLVFGSL